MILLLPPHLLATRLAVTSAPVLCLYHSSLTVLPHVLYPEAWLWMESASWDESRRGARSRVKCCRGV